MKTHRTPRVVWTWIRSTSHSGLFFVVAENISDMRLDHYAVTDDFGTLVRVWP